jgi:hypothetical protein
VILASNHEFDPITLHLVKIGGQILSEFGETDVFHAEPSGCTQTCTSPSDAAPLRVQG